MQPVLVTAAVLQKDGKILLAQRPPTDQMAGLWEFPGGKIEADESPETCLKRELLEELGIDAEIGHFIAQTEHRYPHIYIHLLAYYASHTAGSFVLHTHAAIAWVFPHELLQYSLSPADIPIAHLLANKHGN